jgi:RNA polymerase sigma-70 factor (ECF subfamily)
MTVDVLPRNALDGLAEASSEGERVSAASQSLAEVYDEHVDYVHRCLRGLGLTDAALDDAIQDVFLVVHDKLARFDGRSQLRTWLYAIAVRVARRQRARFARAARDVEAQDVLVWDELDQALDARRQVELARVALDALDAEKREVFVLIEIEQMSAPEAAAIVGAPLNTVYSRLRAARAAFEHELHRQRSLSRRKP